MKVLIPETGPTVAGPVHKTALLVSIKLQKILIQQRLSSHFPRSGKLTIGSVLPYESSRGSHQLSFILMGLMNFRQILGSLQLF